jgi:hypothetical protein
LTGASDFSVLYSIQIGSGANPASYSVNTGKSFPALKLPESEFNNSRAASAEIKNDWSCTSSCPRIFIACFIFSLLYVEIFKLPKFLNIDENTWQ